MTGAMQTTSNLNSDCAYSIARYLTIEDLGRCCAVSRLWNKLFSSEEIWRSLAKKFTIKKERKETLRCFPFKTNGKGDYKKRVKEKILSEEKRIKKNYPREFFEVFENAKTIQKLPLFEIHLEELAVHSENGISYRFKEECFSAPVVRAEVIKVNHYTRMHFIFLRARNNITGEVYRDALCFQTIFRDGFTFELPYFDRFTDRFFFSYSDREERIISPNNLHVNMKKLERLKRLIKKQPVGMITREVGSFYDEGPVMVNGKSVLELV